jgi:adenylate cyclase
MPPKAARALVSDRGVAGPPTDELVALLRSLEVPEPDIARAEADGMLMLLAIEQLALGQEVRYDLEAAASSAGLPADDVRHLWRSLGFPDPSPGDPVFTDVDLGIMAAVSGMLHSGIVSSEVIFGMTRVVGSSMSRIASALIDAVSSSVAAPPTSSDPPAEAVAAETADIMTLFPEILAQVWRRHLEAAARRRLLRSDAGGGSAGLVVGFADLVGFTALAQQVSDAELTEVVDQFERLAYDVVVAGGGHVVKMIGDEVMFIVDDPVVAAEIALGLADASRDAAELSDVRVGLALGPVVEREGDAYGPTVNLASRATAIAYPGTVVVSPDLRAVLEDHDQFGFTSMRPRFLKNIGRVSLSVLRHGDDAPSSIQATIEARRQQMRAKVRQRLAARLGDGVGEGPP